MRPATVAALLAALSCTGRRLPEPVGLAAVVREGSPALAVVASRGVRINARVVPAVEFDDGRLLRLSRGATTADSAYFTEPPWTSHLPDLPQAARLRASYCAAGEAVCRTITLAVSVP